MLRCSRRFLFALAVAATLGSVHAAELGDVRVSSYIGQPLVADVELALVDDPAAVVGVRLASQEVYNGAGIATPPSLGSLNLSVMRRDGRQFLHITSLRAIDSDHLHLYLELTDKGQRSVRLATLWLTPDPNPAPVFAAAPAAATAGISAAAPVPVPAVVARAEPTPAPAAKLVPAPAPAPAPARPRKAAVAAPVRAPQQQAQAQPLPLPIHAVQPAAPAVCAQQAEQAKVCVALDGKNAALREQIGALEGKVKLLQGALKASPVAIKAAPRAHAAPVAAPQAAPATMRPAAPAASVPAAPKPIHAIKPLVPIKPKATPPAPAPETGLPWGWIGAGVALLLALGAAAAVVLRRRSKAVPKVDIPKQPRLAERLRHTFPNRNRPAAEGARAAAPQAAAEMAEPSFE
jgi:hypothetical protein